MMIGRYGMDELNRFLLYLSLGLIVLGIFLHTYIIRLLTVAVLIVLYCRMFSRSIPNRQRENFKFLEMKKKFTGGSKAARADRKAAREGKRVLICPYCKEKLRVPVGAGRIKIRCPHCKQEFEETV